MFCICLICSSVSPASLRASASMIFLFSASLSAFSAFFALYLLWLKSTISFPISKTSAMNFKIHLICFLVCCEAFSSIFAVPVASFVVVAGFVCSTVAPGSLTSTSVVTCSHSGVGVSVFVSVTSGASPFCILSISSLISAALSVFILSQSSRAFLNRLSIRVGQVDSPFAFFCASVSFVYSSKNVFLKSDNEFLIASLRNIDFLLVASWSIILSTIFSWSAICSLGAISLLISFFAAIFFFSYCSSINSISFMSLSFIEFIDFAIVVLLILLPIAFSILPFTFAASIVASHANVSENFAFDSSLHPSVYHIISQSFTHTSSHSHQKNFSYHASAIRPNVGASSVSANSFSVSLSTVIGACVSHGHRSTHAGVNSIHTLKAVLIKSNAGTCDLSK